MAGQSRLTSAYGSNFSVAKLSAELYTQGQPQTRYRQFVDVDSQFGANEGDELQFRKAMNVNASINGAQIAEGERIPTTRFPTRTGTVTANPHGVAVPWTLEYERMSEYEVRGVIKTRLFDNSAKNLDYMARQAFLDTNMAYIATGSTAAPSATWDADGTISTASTRDFQVYDLKNIIDGLKMGVYGSNTATPVEPWDGDNYCGVFSVQGTRAIKDDPEWEKAIHYAAPDRHLNYETGKFADCRIVEDNHLAGQAGGFNGEGMIFGDETVKEIDVIAEEVRLDLPGDHGRLKSMAWFFLGGWSVIWSYDATNEADNRIVKIGSS